MVCEQVSASKQLSSKVNVTIILEETIVVESEGMLDAGKNDLLVLNVINMLASNDLRLFHRLDGILFVGL